MSEASSQEFQPFGSLKVALRTRDDDSDWSHSEEVRIACVPPRVDQLSDQEDIDEDDLKTDAIINIDCNENVVESVECAATIEVSRQSFRRSARILAREPLPVTTQKDSNS